MAIETLVSKQPRLTSDVGTDEAGKVIEKRKSFNNVFTEATAEQLLATATAIAQLQVYPLLAIENQSVTNISE